MKILITDPISKEGIHHLEQQPQFNVLYRTELSLNELKKEISDAAALIVRSKTQVTKEIIESTHRLRAIGRAGAGVDNVDLTAATRKGVVVMNTPEGNSTSAAEHTFALLLALARKIPSADASLRKGQWSKQAFIGTELQNKILGIVGLGKIGVILAQRAQSFQMKVVAYDPFVSEKYARAQGVELLTFEELLARSDFISLHAPLNEKTQGLISRKTLKQMKKGALLINTARGALIVEKDLSEALVNQTIGGVALDVFEKEPEISNQLLQSNAAVFTPHIAGSTIEAQSKVGYEIAIQIADYLQHEIILNAVNFPSMTSQESEQIQPYLRLGERLGLFISQISKIRLSEIGIRYYGDLTKVNYQPISNYILKAILNPILSEEINQVNARNYAKERGISVIETVSSRQRSYSNLISIQLRSTEKTEWIEGAILRQGKLRLVSVDGIPVETQLGNHILFIRNYDTPGVIGQVGTILGQAKINIASFVLGRIEEKPHALGVVNTDAAIPETVLEQIRQIPAVRFSQLLDL